MDNLVLYRKRIIPDECVLLKDDIIISSTNDIIVTKWNALKPRKDLHHGFSCYFLKKGFKVSKFYNEAGELLYWYCDIVEYDYNEANNTLVVTDLLADVIIYPDNYVKVVDIAEIATCVENNALTNAQLIKSLKNLDELLNIIYKGNFDSLTHYINDIED